MKGFPLSVLLLLLTAVEAVAPEGFVFAAFLSDAWADPSAAVPQDAALSELDTPRNAAAILADTCFSCHGPDAAARESGLRLDTADGGRVPAESGRVAIVPGSPDTSELVRRIFSEDPNYRMPPPQSELSLTAAEKETLRKWIAAGAEHQPHWAYTPIHRPALPGVARADWPKDALDFFVLDGLEAKKLSPSPAASREVLLRRINYDLLGLPPTIEQLDRYLQDPRYQSLETVVDELLASPQFGERMAQDWLDAARYGDSNGYHVDLYRSMWRYRDWVIAAFNANMPFDQFTVEQLAGDLLPNASESQRIASGFNRNAMSTEEEGVDPKEYEALYTMDRVATTATVWLGTTAQCAQCHDHKFDPLTQKEYYQLYAFFNSAEQQGRTQLSGNTAPVLYFGTAEQLSLRDTLRAEIERLEKRRSSEAQKLLEQKREALTRVEQDIPSTMIMNDVSPRRATFVLERGDYRSPGEAVEPGFPAFLPQLLDRQPQNRLDLARWLVHPDHPMTARVIVNRYWQQLFGRGIVETSDDFGLRSPAPSNQRLLDYLSREFIDSGWNVKQLLRRIVLSSSYQQASMLRQELRELDPENTLLARGPRFRLSAEMIRDTALAASGLLSNQMGGPSMFPYQSPELWNEVLFAKDEFNRHPYIVSELPDLHRRSLYVFWRRSIPPAVLATFDAPSRETCVVRRQATSTPSQALALLNEEGFVEASRVLAERTLRESAANSEERLATMFRRLTGRKPSAQESQILLEVQAREAKRFSADEGSAKALLAVGKKPVDSSLNSVELASWTVVANTVLNLHEVQERR